MANRNWANSGHIYASHKRPVIVDCNFVVDSTNGNGLGIRNLKGPTVAQVYMNTTATAAVGNPNPAAGTIVIQLQDNFNKSLCGFRANVSPLSGSALQIDNSALTANVAYVITVVGNATAAQWIALGLPAGVIPAIGASFIASSVGAGPGTSTSRVMATAAIGTGVVSFETVGDPNLSIAPNSPNYQGYGASFILQTRNNSGAIAAPADNSVISLSFLLSDGG